MDLFSHALWTAAVYTLACRRLKKGPKPSVRKAALWGVFPDFFAFTLPVVFILISLAFGWIALSDLGRPGSHGPEGVPEDALPLFNIVGTLYSFGHSLAIFLLIFAVVYKALGRPVWELGGWGLHVVIDIFTHSYQFYPTPFLWPLSDFRFNGISWGTPWFLALNYSLLLLVYSALWLQRKKS